MKDRFPFLLSLADRNQLYIKYDSFTRKDTHARFIACNLVARHISHRFVILHEPTHVIYENRAV